MKVERVARKRELLEALLSGKKVKVVKKKKQKEVDADINGDGKVDEKDLGLVRKAIEVAKKKKKKIVKK